jgi:proteic killer suppression protein
VVTVVRLSKRAVKDLDRCPKQVQRKLQAWVDAIGRAGLAEVRKVSGFHDEPIAVGPHAGQRSIRLSQAYRAFYVIERDAVRVDYVLVKEVNKHRYDV